MFVAGSKSMPDGPLAASLYGTTGALPQVRDPTVAEVNDAGFVTKPPLPSGSCQRIGTKLPRATRLSVGGSLAGARKLAKLNSDATVNVLVTDAVKLTRSFPVTLNVRAPAVFVLTISPSATVPMQLSRETSVQLKSAATSW